MAAQGPFAASLAGGIAGEASPVPQYRVVMDLGLDGYTNAALEAAYRHGRGQRRGQGQGQGQVPEGGFGQMHPASQHSPHQHHQQQQQHGVGAGGAIGSGVRSQPAPQFGILTPTQMPGMAQRMEDESMLSMQGHGQQSHASHGRPSGRLVVDPPDLQAWREKLFDVDEMIFLTDEQYETYFPHVDNVYSHRSTQRYKRKPFVSHYWDCRMKGRPPGTPKSDDPSKKKRKRSARERDLCDVKIKITEYFPGAEAHPEAAAAASSFAGSPGQRFWTVQRVNGNGGNGKGDGVAGPHKHTLERSDEIKKNSVQRLLAVQERESKKIQKLPLRRATRAAGATTKKHSKDSDLKLYAACFCPFSQRVWIALEAKGMAYQYCETDPYRRPAATSLLEANPRGLVPAIRHGDWGCAESSVILEYLEDLDDGSPLYPSDPRLRAHCRLWVDHVNTRIVPAFYALLQNQDLTLQAEYTDRLQGHITSLVLAADENGPLFLGNTLTVVDVHFAPFALRLARILRPLRGWSDPVPSTRWHRWLDAMEHNLHVQATTSGDELYVETADLLGQPS